MDKATLDLYGDYPANVADRDGAVDKHSWERS